MKKLVPQKANGTVVRHRQSPGTTASLPLPEFESPREPAVVITRISSEYFTAHFFPGECKTINRLEELRNYLNVAIAQGDSAAEVVGASEMPVERCGIELCENINFVDSTVYAIAHRHVNQPVRSTDRNLQLVKN